jgi:hypothetical protein
MTDIRKKNQTLITRQNVLESLKDLGGGTVTQTKDLLKNSSEDFFRELLGLPIPSVKRSGELSLGEPVQISDVLSGKEDETKKAKSKSCLKDTF